MSETERLCPECGSTLGVKATYCGCGWGKRKKTVRTEPPRVMCFVETCALHAVVKIHTKTGWANLCERHLVERAQIDADAYCAKLGLKTTAQKIAWLRENMKGAIARRLVQREPGEDWGEEEAA